MENKYLRDKREPIIYVTEFKNEFDTWKVFHAFRSKDKAQLDAGRSGRVIECVEKAVYDDLLAENQKLKSERDAKEYAELKSENEQLKAKLEKAKEALRFYANDVYWNKTSVGYYDRIDCSDTSLLIDGQVGGKLIDGQVGGKRARAALKEIEGNK